MVKLMLVIVGGCATEQQTHCRAPDVTTYQCQPQDASSATSDSCVGGPVWQSYAHDGAVTHEDPDLVFPDGCVVLLPECSPYYPADARLAECMHGGWLEPV
jgi:hypothetical protein